MPDTIANNGTAVPDMSRAAAKAIYPNGVHISIFI